MVYWHYLTRHSIEIWVFVVIHDLDDDDDVDDEDDEDDVDNNN